MISRNAATLVVALALLPAAPALAQTSDPLTITASQIIPADVGAARSEPGIVTVSFVNHRNVPATKVELSLSASGAPLETFEETGTFAPGVTIDKTFSTDDIEPHQHVMIAAVTFADGSVWTNPSPPKWVSHDPAY